MISFAFTEEQEAFRSELARFARTRLLSACRDRAVSTEFPWDAHKESARLGVLGIGLPEEYGSAGETPDDPVTVGLVAETLAYGDVNWRTADHLPPGSGRDRFTISVGMSVHDQILAVPPAQRRELLARVADSGLDHVVVADHVSFHGGTGFDGMIGAAAALATEDRLNVLIGVYQLALRHPMAVARQLASLAELAPGRLTLGVGVGGDDRSEVANCGVDPATRGRRIDESLGLLRRLAGGDGLEIWCGLADDADTARACIAEKMQALYKLPFERFERLCPAGTPKQVAEFLRPYVEAGAGSLTLVPCSPDWRQAVDAVAEVRGLLVA